MSKPEPDPSVIRIASDAHRSGFCDHPLDSRRALGFDKNMKQTGVYCQKCATVLERFRNR